MKYLFMITRRNVTNDRFGVTNDQNGVMNDTVVLVKLLPLTIRDQDERDQ